MNSAPSSIDRPVTAFRFGYTRPPMRSLASTIATFMSLRTRSRAAAMPAIPAPTTMTSASVCMIFYGRCFRSAPGEALNIARTVRFCLLLCVLRLLQPLGELQLARSILGLTEIAVSLPEQMVSNRIIGIHTGGMLEGAYGQFAFAFFLQDLAHQDVGPGGSRIQPDRALQ